MSWMSIGAKLRWSRPTFTQSVFNVNSQAAVKVFVRDGNPFELQGQRHGECSLTQQLKHGIYLRKRSRPHLALYTIVRAVRKRATEKWHHLLQRYPCPRMCSLKSSVL